MTRVVAGKDREGRDWEFALWPTEPGSLLGALPPDSVPRWDPSTTSPLAGAEFDSMLQGALPSELGHRIDAVLDEGAQLATLGLADAVPAGRNSWGRHLVLSWYHSLDVATVCMALGRAKLVSGTHDLWEYVPAHRLKSLIPASDEWFARYVSGLPSSQPVNIGFMNPHLCASLCRWGDAKTARQNAMDAHRLASHHDGSPDTPLEWIEKAVNFVFHNLPREHFGIRHEALRPWEELEDRLASDPAICLDPIGIRLAREAAQIMQSLEQRGFLVPWHRLRTDESDRPPDTTIEHSRSVIEEQRKALHGFIAEGRGQLAESADGISSETQRVANQIERGSGDLRSVVSAEHGTLEAGIGAAELAFLIAVTGRRTARDLLRALDHPDHFRSLTPVVNDLNSSHPGVLPLLEPLPRLELLARWAGLEPSSPTGP